MGKDQKHGACVSYALTDRNNLQLSFIIAVYLLETRQLVDTKKEIG